jgi:divinyl chlorophyllide a 8-vinyl-reductase
MHQRDPSQMQPAKRVFVLGATGTIGRATVPALLARGHEVICFIRPVSGAGGSTASERDKDLLSGAELRFGDVTDPVSLREEGLRGERFDAVISCLASRTGAAADAWAIDCRANRIALEAAKAAGIAQMLLLSAICVQKPLLAFQKAKLTFEAELAASGLGYTIIRPTAFFKSLSGQVERVRRGKPFLVFGDGRLTACKPISDRDLGRFIAACLDNPECRDKIMPIGGPGPAITPRDQGDHLFALLGRKPHYTSVPVGLLDAVIFALSGLGRVSGRMRDKAELARIGRYYATQSMLLLNPETGVYEADATPSFGSDTLFDYYAQLLRGEATAERGDHAVF